MQTPTQAQSSTQPFQGQPYYAPTDHLNVIGTLFLVKGILTLFIALFFVAYAFFGSFMTQMSASPSQDFDPALVFILIGVIGSLICTVVGICNIMASHHIKNRKHFNFIFVMAIISCMSGVLGTILGIFTIIDLNKPHVKAQFEDNSHKLG